MRIEQEFFTRNFSIKYVYKTEGDKLVSIIYNLGARWIDFSEGDITTEIDDKIIKFVEPEIRDKISDKLKRYVSLLYDKNGSYFKKVNKVVAGDLITTKLIRNTADNFDPKNQIILDKSALLSCELDDLLK